MRILLLIAAAALAAVVAWQRPNELHQPPGDVVNSAPPLASETIEASGQVLGVGIGTTVADAHARLDGLRDTTSVGLQEKESEEGEAGEKAYWRLKGTDYRWIMVWANSEGRIVQLSASVRPEKLKPFDKIGNLSKAAVNQDNAAKWNVQRADNLSYRLVARGPNRRADSIYMIATTLER